MLFLTFNVSDTASTFALIIYHHICIITMRVFFILPVPCRSYLSIGYYVSTPWQQCAKRDKWPISLINYQQKDREKVFNYT